MVLGRPRELRAGHDVFRLDQLAFLYYYRALEGQDPFPFDYRGLGYPQPRYVCLCHC